MKTFNSTTLADSPYYFGYGSNLDLQDWTSWCTENGFDPEQIAPVGTAVLPDHELVFNYRSGRRRGGALNVRQRLGHVVPGVIFKATPTGWAALNGKEGAPNYYESFQTGAILDDGTEVPVVTYRVCANRVRDSLVAPSPEYLEIVKRGLKRFGLSTHLVEAAAKGEDLPTDVPSIFTYGTLLRGESRFAALRAHDEPKSILLAEACGDLYSLGSFPALIATSTCNGYVSGELVNLQRPRTHIGGSGSY